jgi:hypothetical protein
MRGEGAPAKDALASGFALLLHYRLAPRVALIHVGVAERQTR